MTPIESMTDQELSEAVAVEVAGWRSFNRNMPPGAIGFGPSGWLVPDRGHQIEDPVFATSADAVLPLLYHRHWTVDQTSKDDVPIRVRLDHAHGPYGEANTFPRAAVIALLKAKRANITPPPDSASPAR